jgi:hypothetical protein
MANRGTDLRELVRTSYQRKEAFAELAAAPAHDLTHG